MCPFSFAFLFLILMVVTKWWDVYHMQYVQKGIQRCTPQNSVCLFVDGRKISCTPDNLLNPPTAINFKDYNLRVTDVYGKDWIGKMTNALKSMSYTYITKMVSVDRQKVGSGNAEMATQNALLSNLCTLLWSRCQAYLNILHSRHKYMAWWVGYCTIFHNRWTPRMLRGPG